MLSNFLRDVLDADLINPQYIAFKAVLLTHLLLLSALGLPCIHTDGWGGTLPASWLFYIGTWRGVWLFWGGSLMLLST